MSVQRDVVERTHFIEEDLATILSNKVDYFQAGWFSAAFLACFSATYKDPRELSLHSMALLKPFVSFQRNCHRECPEERAVLVEKAQLVINTMLTDVSALILTLLKHLWDAMDALEVRLSLLDAFPD